MKHLWKLLTLLFLAVPAAGQEPHPPPEGFRKILLPLILHEAVPGAFGSRWATELRLYNDSDAYVRFAPGLCATFARPLCDVGAIPPRAEVVFRDGVFFEGVPNPPATFLYLHPDTMSSIHLSLHIRDLSRQAFTAGTEIPVIRESELLTGKSVFLNVPPSAVPINQTETAAFRRTLRLYDFDSRDAEVKMRVYLRDASQFLVERTIHLPGGTDSYKPGYVQIDPIEGLDVRESVRVELIPVNPGLRYWAFISVTNNETQHVTTITPQ